MQIKHLQEYDRAVISLRSCVVAYACMRISETRKKKNAPRWRLLSTVMGHCRSTELQKERGILRFPDFSQPSPLCCFHITADSKARRRRRRRRHAPSVLQPRIHSSWPAVSQIHLDPGEVSKSTQHKSRRCVFAHVWYTTESPAARSPRPG